MESNFSTRRIASHLKSAFRKWLPAFAVALVAVAAFHLLFVAERGICSAVVNFSYPGVESGLDPNGNRFDPAEMKSADLIRQAAEAIGGSAEPEDMERIADALVIQGSIPSGIFDALLNTASIYGDQLSEVTEVAESAYFPSRYVVKLRYKDAGFEALQGTRFLEELLNAYERTFYERYGYSASLGEWISGVDYAAYDYIDSVEILNDRLTLMRSYLTQLAERDNDRFVSQETGYSFADLIGAADTILSEDVQWLNSYIISNNFSKDKDALTDYYQYKIEDAERALEERQSRLYTLNELIENYVKTNAIFPSAANAERGQENSLAAPYEFSQPSEMYDDLINEKIECQTGISATQEQIALLQRRIERLQNGGNSGDLDILETRLETVREKIAQLLENIRLTADEFFKDEELTRAFQTLAAPKARALAIASDAKACVRDVLLAEVALFGACVLSALWTVFASDRKKASKGVDSSAREGAAESGMSKVKASK